MRIAALDKGAARHIECRVIDREAVATMREQQDLAVEAGEALDATDQDQMVAALMLDGARAFEAGSDALDEWRAAVAWRPGGLGELLGAGAREAHGKRHLISRQHVDREMA